MGTALDLHRIRIWAWAALVTLAGFRSPAAAQSCVIASNSPSWSDDSAVFSLKCDAPPVARVSWDFGDGEGRDSLAGQSTVRHKYASLGSYTVFARVEGQTFPLTTLHTVLHRPTPTPPTQASTLILDRKRARAWCVNADNHSLSVIDATSLVRLKEIPVGRHPRTLALDSLGRVWVANQDDATLTVLDGGTNAVLHTVALPRASRPFGICFDPRGGTAYVTLEATGSLIRLDAVSRQVTGTLKLFPTPRGIAVTHDGSRILVTRFISPADRGEVADVDAAAFTLSGLLPLVYDSNRDEESNGSGVPNAMPAVTIAPDGRRAWIPFKKDNVKRGLFLDSTVLPPTFESTVRTGVALLDLASGKEDYALRKDLDNRSMARAVAFDSKGAFAYVATLTSNHTAILNNATGLGATAIEPDDPVHELAPDGLVLDARDSLLFIHYFMSREVGVYDVTRVGGSNEIPRVALIPTVEKEALAPEVHLGKRIFYNAADPRMARDRYVSCAACHMDGASDGRVWDFTHKGEGLRRTTSLLGRSGMAHGPVHWSANFDEIQDFEHDIRGAFGGTGLMKDEDFDAGRDTPLGGRKTGLSMDLDALAAYVASLTQVNPSPFRNPDGSLTAAAAEGEKIFNSPGTGCASCHAPPRYTDSKLVPGNTGSGVVAVPGGFLLHDVGTLKPGSGKRLKDTLQGLDTPTLLGIWETGPYFHDGSAPTLMDVITTANPGDRHGKTSHLTPQQKEQLVAFLQQLDDAGQGTGFVRAPSARTPMRMSLHRSGAGLLVRLSVPGAGEDARLRVFDAGGRLAVTLRRGPSRPASAGGAGGLQDFQWDGRDAGGKALPTGVYHFHLDWKGGSLGQRAFLSFR